MKLEQVIIDKDNVETVLYSTEQFNSQKANLVLAFAERTFLEFSSPYKKLKSLYSNAQILICSTSGQISNTNLVENSLVATSIQFEKSTIKVTEIDILLNSDIKELGNKIREDLLGVDLKSILIISEGSFINGTELINELILQTKELVPIFGGLAGDEYNFEKTIVGLNADASSGKIIAVGFYGDNIHFGFGSEGGWTDFGPEREVTLSDKNVLYKIGDRSALEIYKEYLGKYANE